MENQRMRMLEVFGDEDSSHRALEVERHRHLLTHNTAYYDTITSLTVVKADGWIYTFNVQVSARSWALRATARQRDSKTATG